MGPDLSNLYLVGPVPGLDPGLFGGDVPAQRVTNNREEGQRAVLVGGSSHVPDLKCGPGGYGLVSVEP